MFCLHYTTLCSFDIGVKNMKKITVLTPLATCLRASPAWPDIFTVGVEATDYMPIYIQGGWLELHWLRQGVAG